MDQCSGLVCWNRRTSNNTTLALPRWRSLFAKLSWKAILKDGVSQKKIEISHFVIKLIDSTQKVYKKLIYNERSFTCPGSHLIGWPKNCRAVTTMDPKTNKAGVSWLDVLNAELSIVIAFLLRNQRASLNIRTNSAIFCMKLNFLVCLFSPASYGVIYISYCV